MLQIRDKKAYRKHIETMNPINAKSVQLVELHAFAYCLLFVYLSESFDIMENMDKEDLTVDDIASRMCMSRTTFYNKWKLLTGEAPKYLISRIRMEKARELLESGKFSVTMVAEMVGMRNLKNFRGRYKEYFGKTPKEFMKKV